MYSNCDKTGTAVTTKMLQPEVSASAHKTKGITVSWSKQQGVSGYCIYRRQGTAGSWSRIKVVNSSVNTYTDTNVAGGTRYYYTVRAYIKANSALGIAKNLYSTYDKTGASAIAPRDKWEKLLVKYKNDSETNQLIFVKYKGGTYADVQMYKKSGNTWNCILECNGYVGQNGIGKTIQGDRKTPVGTFNLTSAFGIKNNPGAKMSYVKVNQYLYWCGDFPALYRLNTVYRRMYCCQRSKYD